MDFLLRVLVVTAVVGLAYAIFFAAGLRDRALTFWGTTIGVVVGLGVGRIIIDGDSITSIVTSLVFFAILLLLAFVAWVGLSWWRHRGL